MQKADGGGRGGVESIFSFVGLAVLAAVLAIFANESRLPAAGMLVALGCGILMLLLLLPRISLLFQAFGDLAGKANINTFYFTTIFKVMGIAYISEFGAQICRDVGQGSLAMKVELAGKIAIMVLAIPIMAAVLQSVLGLLS
ncbi:MAG: stage III sporulation protein AD [Clostridiales bacterium]|nr:stage III sporulation protein AD [Clostridiales bacterium]